LFQHTGVSVRRHHDETMPIAAARNGELVDDDGDADSFGHDVAELSPELVAATLD
jgi:hypothetical protein